MMLIVVLAIYKLSVSVRVWSDRYDKKRRSNSHWSLTGQESKRLWDNFKGDNHFRCYPGNLEHFQRVKTPCFVIQSLCVCDCNGYIFIALLNSIRPEHYGQLKQTVNLVRKSISMILFFLIILNTLHLKARDVTRDSILLTFGSMTSLTYFKNKCIRFLYL